MLSVVNVFKRRTQTQKLPVGLKYFHLLILQTDMKNEITTRIQNEKCIHMFHQEEQSIIMTDETYDNVKHMLNSYEDDVNGDHGIINKIEEDSFDHGLAEQLKSSIEISYNNCLHQDSVLTTLNLVKSKLEKIKEFQSRNIVTDIITKMKMKFEQIFNLS